MKEFKYKAYHKPTQRMFDVYGLGKDFVTEDIFDGVNPGTNCFNGSEMDDVVIMECVPFEQWENKPIFEDDIVKFHYFYAGGGLEGFKEAEHSLIGVVKIGAFGWGLEAIKGEHWEGYTGYGASEGESSFMELCMMNERGIHEESFEVIGNIWQNPELL